MNNDIDSETIRIFDICNNVLRAGIRCDKESIKPCETCRFFDECKKTKEALDDLWKEKG